MLRGQNHKKKKIKIDVFRKFGINLGINVGASSELRSMGCLPPPHSDNANANANAHANADANAHANADAHANVHANANVNAHVHVNC